MKTLSNILAWVLAFSVLAGLIFGAVFVLARAAVVFEKLTDEQRGIFVIAITTAVVFALAVALGVRWALWKSFQDRLRLEKAQVYGRLLETYSTAEDQMGQSPETKKGRAESRRSAERALALWGSNAVVKRYAACQDFLEAPHPEDVEAVAAIEALMIAMRRDVGQRAPALPRGHLYPLLHLDGGKKVT